MEEKKKFEEMSHEELVEECSKLMGSLEIAKRNLYMANASNVIQRMNFLFRVIENYSLFDSKFVESCVTEIQSLLSDEDSESEQKNVSHDA